MERLGVPAAKIRVLRNGVDLNRFRPDGRNEARRDLGLEGSTLLIVGHLRPTKGHERVLQAMTKLPDFNLLIVGDGPLRRSIEVMSQTLSIGDRVRFCGQMSQDELIRYYTAADALILASDREGMPNVVLEALACGTPVVATPVGGVPEVLTESVAGVVADDFSADALVVAVNRLFRQYPDRMATRKYAMNHSWKGTTEGQLDLFGEILMRRQTG
jgi:glycosyltransferase involved in cell wall biosynthesis